jgi:hypothetical protein
MQCVAWMSLARQDTHELITVSTTGIQWWQQITEPPVATSMRMTKQEKWKDPQITQIRITSQ